MSQQERFTTEEILTAIGREMKLQTEHLSKIRTSVGILALVTVISVLVGAVCLLVASS